MGAAVASVLRSLKLWAWLDGFFCRDLGLQGFSQYSLDQFWVNFGFRTSATWLLGPP